MKPVGDSRYDDLATYVREKSRGDTVIVIVLPAIGAPEPKPGFTVQSRDPRVGQWLPDLLRSMAADIEETEPSREQA
jgi:hypothetical protein